MIVRLHREEEESRLEDREGKTRPTQVSKGGLLLFAFAV